MSDDDLRAVLREVDGELDHARVLRTVQARRSPSRWLPLAAAAAVACVLLASVGTLAWVGARDEPSVRPGTAPLPDPRVLAARARVAIAGGDVACTRVEQDGRVVVEQLRRVGPAGVAVLLGTPGTASWPGCGPDRAPTGGRDEPTGEATRAPSYDLKRASTRDLLAPLGDPGARAATASRTADGAAVVRVETARLRYDYELDAADRPVAVRVRPRDASTVRLSATVRWFAPESVQGRYLVASGT